MTELASRHQHKFQDASYPTVPSQFSHSLIFHIRNSHIKPAKATFIILSINEVLINLIQIFQTQIKYKGTTVEANPLK
jgi:hypothetical protein